MAGLGTLSTLPPELRIQIYNYVLANEGEEIHVVPTIHPKLSEDQERQRIMRLNRRAAEGRPRKRVAVKNAILYVSKAISEEACAVLYGGYKFRLGTTQALDWFLVLIGENRQHIRHICVLQELGMRNLPAVGRITNNLVDAGKLRSLTLRAQVMMYVGKDKNIRFFENPDVRLSHVGGIITKLAVVSEKLLKSLHSAQESEDKLAGVVGIFQLDVSPHEEQLSALWRSAVELRIREST